MTTLPHILRMTLATLLGVVALLAGASFGSKFMKLKRLLIEREYFGELKGQLVAKITVDDAKSEISLQLEPDATLRLVQCCLDELVHATELGAAELKSRLLSLHQKLLAPTT